MTGYNKRTYRLDDIAFDKNPRTTFHLRKEDRDISYIDYYKSRYQIVIKNETQPLLVSRPTRKDKNRGDDEPVYLIPELCGMTGLTEDMRCFNRFLRDSRKRSINCNYFQEKLHCHEGCRRNYAC